MADINSPQDQDKTPLSLPQALEAAELFLSLVQGAGDPGMSEKDRERRLNDLGEPTEIIKELTEIMNVLAIDGLALKEEHKSVVGALGAVLQLFENENQHGLNNEEILSGVHTGGLKAKERIAEDNKQYLWIYDLTHRYNAMLKQPLQILVDNVLNYHPNLITMINSDVNYPLYRKRWHKMAKTLIQGELGQLENKSKTALEAAVNQPKDQTHSDVLNVLQLRVQHPISYRIDKHPSSIITKKIDSVRYWWARKLCEVIQKQLSPEDYWMWFQQMMDIVNHQTCDIIIPEDEKNAYNDQLNAKVIEWTQNTIKLMAELAILKLTLGFSKLVPLRYAGLHWLIKTLFDVNLASLLKVSYKTLYEVDTKKLPGKNSYPLNYIVGNAMISEVFLLSKISKHLKIEIDPESKLATTILFLDQYGRNIVGANGIHNACAGNYTDEQIDYLVNGLTNAGLRKFEATDLVERGLVGRVDFAFFKWIAEKNIKLKEAKAKELEQFLKGNDPDGGKYIKRLQ